MVDEVAHHALGDRNEQAAAVARVARVSLARESLHAVRSEKLVECILYRLRHAAGKGAGHRAEIGTRLAHSPRLQRIGHGPHSTRFLIDSRLGVGGGIGGIGGAGVTGRTPKASSPGCTWVLNIAASWVR